jgi:hypothetical protein
MTRTFYHWTLSLLMNREVGYVQMVNVADSSYKVPIPRDIIDSGHHFDDCPWAARQSRRAEVIGINELPQTTLLNHVIDSHKRHVLMPISNLVIR